MEKIEPGKYVELVYELYRLNPDGTQEKVHESDPADPERIIVGVTPGVIRPLEEAITGKVVGDAFDVSVPASQAFGVYDVEQVAELDRDIFVVDGAFDAEVIRPGALVPMMTADGYRINGKVLEVTDEHVKMDFNHPLAGADVRFVGTVKTVRDATPEELAPAHGCGCGCDHDHCGDGCEGCH